MKSRVLFIINKFKIRGGIKMLSTARIRAYARTIDAEMRTIDEVDENYRVAVFIELIARYNLKIEAIDERYSEAVKKELVIQ